MAKILPHNARIRSDVSSYLREVADIVSECTQELHDAAEYRNIYKTCLATDSVLRKLSHRETPRLAVARGLIQRVPFLVAAGQLPSVRYELRRFVEVVLWCIYFSDHAVEWKTFQENPTKRFVKDISQPIVFCAFRERAFFSNYAAELFKNEPSGIALEAARELSRRCNELNAEVHPQKIATAGGLRPAWDRLTDAELAATAKVHRSVCSACCVMLAAYLKQRFNRLPPVHRAWFDWLIGSGRAKKTRSGRFGLDS